MKKFLLISMLIGGCSWDEVKNFDRSPDYRQSRVVNNLEVPPNLVAVNNQDMAIPNENISASYLAQESQKNSGEFITVLPELYKTQVQGNRVESQATPDQVWRWLINYWNKRGIRLVTSDNLKGLMVTDWLVDKNKLPQGMISGALSSLGLTDSGERDRYRVQLERHGNSTALVVSHSRAEEEIAGRNSKDSVPDYKWVEGKTGDQQLAEDMAKRIGLEISQQLRRLEQPLAPSSGANSSGNLGSALAGLKDRNDASYEREDNAGAGPASRLNWSSAGTDGEEAGEPRRRPGRRSTPRSSTKIATPAKASAKAATNKVTAAKSTAGKSAAKAPPASTKAVPAKTAPAKASTKKSGAKGK